MPRKATELRQVTELPAQDVLFMDRKTKQTLTANWNQKQMDIIKAGKRSPVYRQPIRVDTPPKQRIAREHKAITERIDTACRNYDDAYGLLNEEISSMADDSKKDWFSFDARRQRMAAITTELRQLKDADFDEEIVPHSSSAEFPKYMEENNKTTNGDYLTTEYVQMFKSVSQRAVMVAEEGEKLLAIRAQEISDLIEGSRGDETEEIANDVQQHIEGVLEGVRTCGAKLGTTLTEVWGRMDMYRIQLYGQEEEIKECRQKVLHFSREMIEAQNKVRSEEQEKGARELEDQKALNDRNISKLTIQVDALVRESKQLREKNAEGTQGLRDELARMTAVASCAENAVEELHSRLDEHKRSSGAELKDLQIKSAAAVQAAQSEAEVATARGLELGKQVLHLEKELEEMKLANSKIQTLEAKVKSLEEQLSATQDAVVAKETELAEEKANNADSSAKIASIQEELDSALESLRQTEQMATEAQAAHLAAMQELSNTAAAEKESLTKELNQSKADLATIASSSNAFTEELTELKAQLAKQKEQLKEAQIAAAKQLASEAQAAAAAQSAQSAQNAVQAADDAATKALSPKQLSPIDAVLKTLDSLRCELTKNELSRKVTRPHCITADRAVMAKETKRVKGLKPGTSERNEAERALQESKAELDEREATLASDLDCWERISEIVRKVDNEMKPAAKPDTPSSCQPAVKKPPTPPEAEEKAPEETAAAAAAQVVQKKKRRGSASVAVQSVESDFAPSAPAAAVSTGTEAGRIPEAAESTRPPKAEMVSTMLRQELLRMMQICGEEAVAAVEAEEAEIEAAQRLNNPKWQIIQYKQKEIEKAQIELQKLAEILHEFEDFIEESNEQAAEQATEQAPAAGKPKREKKKKLKDLQHKFALDAKEAVKGIPMAAAAKVEKVLYKLQALKDTDTAGMAKLSEEVKKMCTDAKDVDPGSPHGEAITMLDELAEGLKSASNNKEAELAAVKLNLKRAERTITDLESNIRSLENKLREGKSRAAQVLAERRGISRIEHDKIFPGVLNGQYGAPVGSVGGGSASDSNWGAAMNGLDEHSLSGIQTVGKWDADSFVNLVLEKRKKSDKRKKSKGDRSPSPDRSLLSPDDALNALLDSRDEWADVGVMIPPNTDNVYNEPQFPTSGGGVVVPPPMVPWIKKNKSRPKIQPQHILHQVHQREVASDAASLMSQYGSPPAKLVANKLKSLPQASPEDIAKIRQTLPPRVSTPPITGAQPRPESRSRSRQGSGISHDSGGFEKSGLGSTQRPASQNEPAKKLYNRKEMKDKVKRGVHKSTISENDKRPGMSLPRLGSSGAEDHNLADGMTADEKMLYAGGHTNAWEDPEISAIFA